MWQGTSAVKCVVVSKNTNESHQGEACPRGRDVLDLAIVRARHLPRNRSERLAQTNRFKDLADPFSLAPVGVLERQNAGPPWQLRSLFDVTLSLISSYMAPLRDAGAHKSCHPESHGAGHTGPSHERNCSVCHARTGFVWKIVDLYGSTLTDATIPFMGPGCIGRAQARLNE